MLTGLIFATENAVDRPEMLAATLSFGGATLIEYQARLLVAGGAAQILIAVARVTPELLGAAARIGKRGVAVDVVRSATEAAAKVHPLARVVMLADGLVTNETVLGPFLEDGGDLLLVTDTTQGLERIDANSCWAGIARFGAQRLSETAALPRDYDFLSTLLRVVAQHRPAKLMLDPGTARSGHGIEHDSRGLAQRSSGVFAALAATRQPWIERWLLAPLARFALPLLVGRAVPPPALLAGGGIVALAAIWGVLTGWTLAGLAGATLASWLLLTGGLLAWLRGEEAAALWSDRIALMAAGATMLAVGWWWDGLHGTATGLAVAASLLAALGLVERIRPLVRARRWWPAPAAFPLLLIPFAALGQSLIGLAALAAYAGLTLLGAIEDARAQA